MENYLLIILAAGIFGSSGLFIKFLSLDVSTITFFRMAVPFIFLSLIFLIRKKRLPGFKNKNMILASILNSARMFFYFAGYTYGNIGTTVILLYTWPVFTALWSFIFLKEKQGIKKAALFLLTFAGVLIVYLDKTISLSTAAYKGMAAILISSFLYSFTVVLFKKESSRYDQWETVWYQNLAGCFIFLPFIFINKPFPSFSDLGIVSFYAFLIGIAGFGLFFKGLKYIDASKASFLTYFEVVSAVFFGVIFLHEKLTWNIFAGGFLIILSAILITRIK